MCMCDSVSVCMPVSVCVLFWLQFHHVTTVHQGVLKETLPWIRKGCGGIRGPDNSTLVTTQIRVIHFGGKLKESRSTTNGTYENTTRQLPQAGEGPTPLFVTLSVFWSSHLSGWSSSKNHFITTHSSPLPRKASLFNFKSIFLSLHLPPFSQNVEFWSQSVCTCNS